MSGSRRRGDTASATARTGASAAEAGPCLFVVACGRQPRLAPVRIRLGRVRRVDVGRADGSDVTVRRDDETIDVALPDAKVSGSHACIEHVYGRWFVTDHGSKNGTFVGGRRAVRQELGDGAVVDVGDTLLRFRAAVEPGGDVVYRPGGAAMRGTVSMLPAVQAELDRLRVAATSAVTILIEGETGTGKDVAAQAVHAASRRAGAFVAVNCGALPGDRVAAELFGWRRASFSGATADHVGLVRAADGGTLFLDEIGDLPSVHQAALLRVLEQREVLPIGASEPIAVDVRIVAATHQPLDEMVARGTFRRDLLARLCGYRARLTPLRERIEDLGLLVGDLLAADHAGRAPRLTVQALRAMANHSWPTNIRGLGQALAGALLDPDRNVIDVAQLPREVSGDDRPARAAAEVAAPAPGLARGSAGDPRRARLVSLLQEHHGNVAAVARSMDKARMQIQRWLKAYAIDPDEYRR